MRSLLLLLTATSFVLAVAGVVGKIAQNPDLSLYDGLPATAVAISILGFLLTWACAVLEAIAYGLAYHALPQMGGCAA